MMIGKLRSTIVDSVDMILRKKCSDKVQIKIDFIWRNVWNWNQVSNQILIKIFHQFKKDYGLED
jgi:hypothetical protein